MTKAYKVPDKEFIEAVRTAETYTDLLRNLGYAPNWGRSGRESVKKRIEKLGLDDSHLLKHKWRRGLPGKSRNRNIPLEKVLVKGRKCDSGNLRLKLIREGIFIEKCSRCNLTGWQGGRIPLNLHHVDGDRMNNILENLVLLCPNCHTLTSTFCGKNHRTKKERKETQ